MSDLVMRSGRCHGPDCHRTITDRDRSPDFCSEECQTHWHRLWTRGTAVTKGWVRPRQYRGVLTCDPGCHCRTSVPSAVFPFARMSPVEITAVLMDPDGCPPESVAQEGRWYQRLRPGWWRPNG